MTEESNLVLHAKRELDLLGMTENAGDQADKLGREGVLELVRMFSQQGHSGSSAAWMIDIVQRLLRYEPLSPLTDDPDEWMEIADYMTNGEDLWQSRRNPAAFSHDGGETYYLVDELVHGDSNLEVTPVYRTEPRKVAS